MKLFIRVGSRSVTPYFFLKELNQDLRVFSKKKIQKKPSNNQTKKGCHICLMGVERVNSLCALFNTDEGGEFMLAW